MIVNSVNLNYLRIFESVFRTRSMTQASKELHMTQSGVSQHIKSLEETLGVKLFDRIQKRLIPTEKGALLFRECSQNLYRLDQVLSQLKEGQRQLRGTVSIGMPIEFGNSIILPLIAKFSEQHPLVKFRFRLGLASVMNELLQTGELDFAFVDNFTMEKTISTERVYDEILELCMDEELVVKYGAAKSTKEYFEKLDYVEYQEGSPILKMWFGHHLKLKTLRLNTKATVMDVQSVARLIVSKVGAGVLPGHLLAKLQQDGARLHVFKGCGKPLKNTISLAYLTARTQSSTVTSLISSLKDSLKVPNKR